MARRKSKQAAFSLFSFQDIITSVTGIMILITLMLAIELLDRTDSLSASTKQAQLEDLEKMNSELEQQIKKLQASIDSQTSSTEDLPSLDEATLEKMKKDADSTIEKLSKDIQDQESKLKKNQSKLAKMKKDDSSSKSKEERELQALKDQNDKTSKKLAEYSSSDRKFFSTGIKDKDVWVVEFAGGKVRAAKIGIKMTPKSFSTASSFISWTKSLGSKTALYLLVKPSGISLYRQARGRLPSSLDVGFSVIDPKQTIMDPVFGVAKP